MLNAPHVSSVHHATLPNLEALSLLPSCSVVRATKRETIQSVALRRTLFLDAVVSKIIGIGVKPPTSPVFVMMGPTGEGSHEAPTSLFVTTDDATRREPAQAIPIGATTQNKPDPCIFVTAGALSTEGYEDPDRAPQVEADPPLSPLKRPKKIH